MTYDSQAVDHVMKFPRPSLSIFAYCKRSKTGGADVSWVQKATSQLYRRNVPLVHTSRHVTARDQFYQAFSRISTASNKRWGERHGDNELCNLLGKTQTHNLERQESKRQFLITNTK